MPERETLGETQGFLDSPCRYSITIIHCFISGYAYHCKSVDTKTTPPRKFSGVSGTMLYQRDNAQVVYTCVKFFSIWRGDFHGTTRSTVPTTSSFGKPENIS